MRLALERQQWLPMILSCVMLALTFAWARPFGYQHQAIRLNSAPDYFRFIQASANSVKPVSQAWDSAELKITAELRLLFDYFYNKAESQSIRRATAELEQCLIRQVSASEIVAVLDLFERYASYQNAWSSAEQRHAQLRSQADNYQELSARLHAMHDLRGQFFSAAEAQALFAIDDEYDKNNLQQLLNQRGKAEQSTAVEPKVLQLAAGQVRNYQGSYVQYLSDH